MLIPPPTLNTLAPLLSPAHVYTHIFQHTGHVTRWNNDWYSQLSSLFNRNTITTVARSQMQAVDWVRDTIQRERIDCHWQEVPTVLFANTDGDEHLRRLRAEREACRVVGWHDVMQEAWGFVAPQHLGGGRGDKAGGVGEDNHGRAGTAVPVNQCLVFPNGSGQLDPIKVCGWVNGCM